MRFILKTVREHEMEKAVRFGFVDGIVLPRSEAERTGRHYDNLIRSSLKYPFSLIGIEIQELSSREVSSLLQEYGQMDPSRIVAFLPMTLENLGMARESPSTMVALGVQHAVTLIQVLAALRSGFHVLHISAKAFRDYGLDLFGLIEGIRSHLQRSQRFARIWVDDVSSATEANQLAELGIDALIFTWDMLQELLYHPLTDQALERTLAPWVDPDSPQIR